MRRICFATSTNGGASWTHGFLPGTTTVATPAGPYARITDPSVGFDTTAYLAAYPDVAAAGVNPLVHFLQFGQHEGRSAFADGVWG